MTPDDAYRTLMVSPDADDIVVQAAYRALARRYHADGTDPDAQRMVAINRAWERVGTPDRRARYDATRRTAIPVSAPGERYDAWKHAGMVTAKRAADVVDFGRYAGWRIADLVRHDPDYVRWLSRHSSGVRFLDAIARCLPGDAGIGRHGTVIS